MLKASRASALCPLSCAVFSTIFLFVYDFAVLEVLLVPGSLGLHLPKKKSNHQINASALLSYLASSRTLLLSKMSLTCDDNDQTKHEFQICDSIQLCTRVSHGHVGLNLPFSFPLSARGGVKATRAWVDV